MGAQRIGKLLVEGGVITPQKLEDALHVQKQKGGRIGDVLLGLGALTEEQLQNFLAHQFQLRYYRAGELLQLEVGVYLLNCVTYDVALQYLVLPLGYPSPGVCEVAVTSMLTEEQELFFLGLLNCTRLQYALAARTSLVQAIQHHYIQLQWQHSSNAVEGRTILEKDLYDSHDLLKMQEQGVFDEPTTGSLIPTDKLGDWRLIRLLGKGGMGLVYKAVHCRTKEKSAIKILRTKLNEDDIVLQRFYREVEILRRLRHPAITKIYEFEYREDLGFYLVMELLEGCTFAEFLKGKTEDMSFNQVYQVFSVVCDAMHYAHEKGIVHRDLKPDNIFLGGTQKGALEVAKGPVKILDFGIAKLQQEKNQRLTQTGSTLGTPHYISPEQATASPLDHRSDIYSLSVVLFEILTGKSLFVAESPFQYLMRHVYAEPPSLSAARPDRVFPEQLERLLARGLAKKPEDRPATMKEFLRLLSRALAPYIKGAGVDLKDTLDEDSQDIPKLEVDTLETIPAEETPASQLASSVRFLQSNEWDSSSVSDLSSPSQKEAKDRPAKDRPVLPQPAKHEVNRGAESVLNSNPAKASGGILGDVLSSEPAPSAVIGSPTPSQTAHSQVSSFGKNQIGVVKPLSRSKSRHQVVIRSPRWDLAKQKRSKKRILFWCLLSLLLGLVGVGSFLYRDQLFLHPLSIQERRSARKAWVNWHKRWRTSYRRNFRTSRRRSRYRRRRSNNR